MRVFLFLFTFLLLIFPIQSSAVSSLGAMPAGQKGIIKFIVDLKNSSFKAKSGNVYKVKYAYLFFSHHSYWKIPIYTGHDTPGQLLAGKPYERVTATVFKKYKWYTKSFGYFMGSMPYNTSLERSPGNAYGKYAWSLIFHPESLMAKYKSVMIHGSAESYGVNAGTKKNYIIKRNDNDIRDLGIKDKYYYSLGCVHITNKMADVLNEEGMIIGKTRVIFLNSTLKSEESFLQNQIIADIINWGIVYLTNPLRSVYVVNKNPPPLTDKGRRFSPRVVKIDQKGNYIGKINNRYYKITKL